MRCCDEKTYRKLDHDPVASVERMLYSSQLKKKGSISQDLYNRLHSSGGCTPLLYGLPKVHKPDVPDVPLHPIDSFVSSPSYQLSKHTDKILSPLVGNSDSHVLTRYSLCPSLVPRSFNQIAFWSPLIWFLYSQTCPLIWLFMSPAIDSSLTLLSNQDLTSVWMNLLHVMAFSSSEGLPLLDYGAFGSFG